MEQDEGSNLDYEFSSNYLHTPPQTTKHTPPPQANHTTRNN